MVLLLCGLGSCFATVTFGFSGRCLGQGLSGASSSTEQAPKKAPSGGAECGVWEGSVFS